MRCSRAVGSLIVFLAVAFLVLFLLARIDVEDELLLQRDVSVAASDDELLNDGSVPFAQSPLIVIDALTEIASISQHDTLFDLGCGDGRLVQHIVSRTGCRAVCVEQRKDLLDRARLRMMHDVDQQRSRVDMRAENLSQTNISTATVIYLYLAAASQAVAPRLFEDAAIGTVIVSLDHPLVPYRAVEAWGVRLGGTDDLDADTAATAVLFKYIVGGSSTSYGRTAILTHVESVLDHGGASCAFHLRQYKAMPQEVKYTQECKLHGGNDEVMMLCCLVHVYVVDGIASTISVEHQAVNSGMDGDGAYRPPLRIVCLADGQSEVRCEKDGSDFWRISPQLKVPLMLRVSLLHE